MSMVSINLRVRGGAVERTVVAVEHLLCEDHVAVLGDSHWVRGEGFSGCGRWLILMCWSLGAALLGRWLNVGCWVVCSRGAGGRCWGGWSQDNELRVSEGSVVLLSSGVGIA